VKYDLNQLGPTGFARPWSTSLLSFRMIVSAGCLRCRSSAVGPPGSHSRTITLSSPDVSHVEPYTSSRLWTRLLPLARGAAASAGCRAR
jgi:hypothetical protein